jgi:enoyl-CoA hydratase/carnithine racemase
MNYERLGPDYSGLGSGKESGPIATVTLNAEEAGLLRRALSEWLRYHWCRHVDQDELVRALIEECGRGFALGDDLDEVLSKFDCPDEQAKVVGYGGYRQRVADIQAQADEDEDELAITVLRQKVADIQAQADEDELDAITGL